MKHELISKGETVYSKTLKCDVFVTENSNILNPFVQCEFKLSGRLLKNMYLPVSSLIRKENQS